MLVLFCSVAHGRSLTIEGNNYRYDSASKTHRYTDSKVVVNDLNIYASRLQYDERNMSLKFSENVTIDTIKTLFTAETAVYHLKTKIAILYNATAYDKIKKAFVTAAKIERITDNDFIIHDGSVSYCHPDSPAWEIRSNYINYGVDSYAYAYNTSLHLHTLPIFYTPFLAWPTTRKRGTGFVEPEFMSRNSSDASKNYGNRLKIPYFINLDQDHDLTITADAIQRRGLGFDFDYQYAFVPGMRGQFNVWYIDEMMTDRHESSETLGIKNWGDQDPRPERYRYSFDHRQNIFWGGQFFFHQSEKSDNEVNKEYFDSSASLETHFSRTFNASFPLGNGNLSFSHTANDSFVYESVYSKETDVNTHLNQQPAIEISQRFSQIFDTPLTFNISNNYTQYHRYYGWRGGLNITRTTFDLPFSIDFLNVISSLERDFYMFDVEYNADPDGTETDENPAPYGWRIDTKKLELNFEFFRFFKDENEYNTGKLSFRPRAIYYDVENVDQSDIHFISAVTSQKWISYQLEAEFLTKDVATELVRKPVSASLIQTYNLADNKTAENGATRLPLRFKLSVAPVPDFSASLFYRYDYDQSKITETSISLSNKSHDGHQFSLTYSLNTEQYYELDGTDQPQTQSYSLSQILNITDQLRLSVSGTWDVNRQDLDQRYGSDAIDTTNRLNRDLISATASLVYEHDCYKITFSYQEEVKDRTIDEVNTEVLDRTVMVVFSINQIPTGGLYGVEYSNQ